MGEDSFGKSSVLRSNERISDHVATPFLPVLRTTDDFPKTLSMMEESVPENRRCQPRRIAAKRVKTHVDS
jgi:hypothetical protein